MWNADKLPATPQKHQFPSSKSQTITKFQFRKIEIDLLWNLVIWNLGFGNWDFYVCGYRLREQEVKKIVSRSIQME